MTFLKTRFHLTRPVNEKDFPKFGRLSTVYGLRGVAVQGDELAVDYDASRLHEAEVLAEVRKLGLPVTPATPIPSGAFDSTGEFKDFAWPTSGLSPVNQPRK
jgi:hypothetical protein